MRTMWEALKICLPITLMTFAIFTRSNMVVTTGWLQIADTILVLVSTCGVAFAMFGRFFESFAADIPSRVLLAVLAFVTMFHPSDTFVWLPGIAVLVAVLIGIWRHRLIAAPPALPAGEPGDFVPALDDRMIAGAKRDFG